MNHDQLRQVKRALREGHQRLFDLQGQQIDTLQEALRGLARQHEEMVKLLIADNDLDDATEESH